MAQKKIERLDTWPAWFTGKTINEPIFCREFLERHHLAYTENSFFTTEGRVTNEDAMRQTIYQQLEPFIVTGMSKKVDDIMKDLRIKAQVTGLLRRQIGFTCRMERCSWTAASSKRKMKLSATGSLFGSIRK